MPGAVVLLSGRSFSGKSTIAKALEQALPAEVVSYDAINAQRGLHGGEGIAVEEWARTNDIAHERAVDLLARGAAVIVDDTSSPRLLRDAWRDLARRSDAILVLVFIDISPAVLRERLLTNRSQTTRHDVLDDVMADHLAAFESPAPDERHTRFDENDTTDGVVDGVLAELRHLRASGPTHG